MENNGSQAGAGLNIASMVLGIIGLVLMCFTYVSIPCSILAIILGLAGMSHEGRGMGIAGLVCGIITMAVLLLSFAQLINIFSF